MRRATLSFALAAFVMFPGNIALAQMTLEIPEEEFESVEDYKPIPTPDPSSHPVDQMFDTMEFDMTGTLPEAVLEDMLGATPYDFVDVVWSMEVTGDWTDRMTGKGTLQVTDFTEGKGAQALADPERYTGQGGFRMYNARLRTDGDHVFTLSAAFPPDEGGVALGTELDGVKGVFEVTWLCHMFEPGRRGCVDYTDDYYETELPELEKMTITRTPTGHRIEFAARVRETRTHRERGYRLTEPTGRFADVHGWVCDKPSFKAAPDACGETASGSGDVEDVHTRTLSEEALRETQAELADAIARAQIESDTARIVAESKRQAQEQVDEAARQMEAEVERVRAEVARADLERQIQDIERQAQQQVDDAVRRMEAEVARKQAEIMRAEQDRQTQQRIDQVNSEVQSQIEAELARVRAKNAQLQLEIEIERIRAQAEELHDAAIAEAENALAESDAAENASIAEDEADEP
ncbi:hypothetical protein [Salinihabitans flavidus]|nr:hypothetical protein [Salinihabitans flavidus]